MTSAVLAAGGIGRVVVVDSHPIFRRGLVAVIGGLDEVQDVYAAGSVTEARERTLVTPFALVTIDHAIEGALEFVEDAVEVEGVRVVICSDYESDELVRASFKAGAIAFLVKRTIQPGTLSIALLAAADGNCFISGDLLRRFTHSPNEHRLDRPTPPPAASPTSPLTEREHRVLELIAKGEPTREVARQLCYSERTVKNVLHDIVVKLGARSRSQAVAHAVRLELI